MACGGAQGYLPRSEPLPDRDDIGAVRVFKEIGETSVELARLKSAGSGKTPDGGELPVGLFLLDGGFSATKNRVAQRAATPQRRGRSTRTRSELCSNSAWTAAPRRGRSTTRAAPAKGVVRAEERRGHVLAVEASGRNLGALSVEGGEARRAVDHERSTRYLETNVTRRLLRDCALRARGRVDAFPLCFREDTGRSTMRRAKKCPGAEKDTQGSAYGHCIDRNPEKSSRIFGVVGGVG